MNYIDTKYISLVSVRLNKFSEKKKGLYNFRCPYCGDSQKYKNKCRGYIFQKKNDMIFKCHNCGVGRSLANFLKDQDINLHDQYVMERYKNGLTGKGSNTPNPVFNFPKPKFKEHDICSELTKVSDLNKEHLAKEYLLNRKIKNLSDFYYCPNFMEWTNKHKETFENIKKDEPRIIIPLRDEKGVLFGFQGRSLGPNNLKYITILLDEDAPKLYGLNRINKNKPIYITEGPFDSTFVENSVAMCGSDVDIRTFGWSNYIWIYDNEPRSREICNRISKTIDRGDTVIIWPNYIREKDINDMIIGGHDVSSVLESNTYSGLEAKLKFNTWKKV